MRKRRSKEKARMGRPPMGAKARRIMVGLRVSKIELVALRKAAKARGMSLGAYIMAPHRRGEG